jgi:HD superfamily phosphohydrolase
MSKIFHEIRDPIHVFIHLNSYEKLVLDSRPFQRLRDITQLALTYLLYPGATHKRFEHSLGVMELAGRVFDGVGGFCSAAKVETASSNSTRVLLIALSSELNGR